MGIRSEINSLVKLAGLRGTNPTLLGANVARSERTQSARPVGFITGKPRFFRARVRSGTPATVFGSSVRPAGKSTAMRPIVRSEMPATISGSAVKPADKSTAKRPGVRSFMWSGHGSSGGVKSMPDPRYRQAFVNGRRVAGSEIKVNTSARSPQTDASGNLSESAKASGWKQVANGIYTIPKTPADERAAKWWRTQNILRDI